MKKLILLSVLFLTQSTNAQSLTMGVGLQNYILANKNFTPFFTGLNIHCKYKYSPSMDFVSNFSAMLVPRARKSATYKADYFLFYQIEASVYYSLKNTNHYLIWALALCIT